MQTFLLVGFAYNGKAFFPKPICTVKDETISDAARKLGGHLHDIGMCDDDRLLSVLFMPGLLCADFHAGETTAEKLAQSFIDALGDKADAKIADGLRAMTPKMLSMFERVVLGTLPSIA